MKITLQKQYTFRSFIEMHFCYLPLPTTFPMNSLQSRNLFHFRFHSRRRARRGRLLKVYSPARCRRLKTKKNHNFRLK